MFRSMQIVPASNRGAGLLVFFLLLLLPYNAYAVPDLYVTSVSGSPGSTVTVSVMADLSVAVNSMQFDLQFDPNLLTVSSVTTGSANSSWAIVSNPNQAGTVGVAMFNLGGSSSSVCSTGLSATCSQQQIVVIQFTVNNPPGDSSTSSSLILSNVYFDATNVTQLTAGIFTSTSAGYALTVNESGNGSVTESTTINGVTNTVTDFTSGNFTPGTVVQLTPVPGSGYQFSNWSSGASGNANPLSITMNAVTVILANFSANVSPSITTQPVSVTVTAPATATFTAAASGTPAPTYQWENSTNGGTTWATISGATGASYTTAATTASESGTEYELVATNSAGFATSNAAILTVNPTPVMPSITTQPVSQQVTAPATATYGVVATGVPAPTYQWRISTNGGNSYTNISGATSTKYTTPPTTVSNSGSQFQCVVTNIVGSKISNLATLTVKPTPVAPSITTQPVSVTVTAPATATFTAVASGTPTPTYQWKVSTNGGTTWAAISGATSASYTTPATAVSNSGTEYELIVTNSAGNATSNAVTLTVNPTPVAPSITTQPVSQVVTAPATAIFTAVATGTPTPTYQWQVSTNGGITWATISGATSASYTINPTTTAMSGYEYECVASNGVSPAATTNAATLTVNPTPVAPSITTQPISQVVTAPAAVTFTTAATGMPTPTYQWQVSTNGGTTWAAISGATSAAYTINPTSTAMSGYEYECIASNGVSPAATTNAVTLTVNPMLVAPSITTQPVGQVVTAPAAATFTTAATGIPTPTYQWQVSTNGGTTWAAISGATSAAYTINPTSTAMSGYEYECIASNGVSPAATTNAVTLTVNPTPVIPSITTQPVSQQVTAPAAATYGVVATGVPAPTYQWRISTNGGNSYTNISGATSTKYTTPPTTVSNSGSQFQCVVTNIVGSRISNLATLTVNTPVAPTIKTQPVSETVTVSSTATFTVAASGAPTPTYQWLVSTNGGTTWAAINGATSTSYRTSATTLSNSGTEYYCEVTNTVGSVASNVVVLTVNPLSSIITTSDSIVKSNIEISNNKQSKPKSGEA